MGAAEPDGGIGISTNTAARPMEFEMEVGRNSNRLLTMVVAVGASMGGWAEAQVAPGSVGGVTPDSTGALEGYIEPIVPEAGDEYGSADATLDTIGAGLVYAPGFSWTQFRPSADSRIIYVSNSTGNDANDGTAWWKAVKSIERAKDLVRNGYPDWVLLRRGDTWETGLGQWKKGGRSAKEPMVVGTFGGGPRPILKGTTGVYFNGGGGSAPSVDNLAVTSIHFWAAARDPDSGEYTGTSGGNGMEWVHPGRNILVEDCMFDSFRVGVMLTGVGAGIHNFQLRGSVVVDSYNTSGHSQGIYVTNVKGLLVEGCVFDHNGWNNQVSGGHPTIYNHNMYIDDVSNWGTTEGVIIRDNIIANAASHGVQLRPGGVIANNLFVGNSLGCFVGLAPSAIRNNVMIEPKDISPSLPRGYGIDVLQCDYAVVENNVVAHKASGVGTGPAIRVTTSNDMSVPSYNVAVRNNVVFNWNGTMFQTTTDQFNEVIVEGNDFQSWNYPSQVISVQSLVSAPSNLDFASNAYDTARSSSSWFEIRDDGSFNFDGWTQASGDQSSAAGRVSYQDPFRSLASYHAAWGRPASTASFLAEARKQAKGDWRTVYYPRNVNRYIRWGLTRR